jgi:protein phosphatase 1B
MSVSNFHCFQIHQFHQFFTTGLSTSRSLGDTDSRFIDDIELRDPATGEIIYLVSPVPEISRVKQVAEDLYILIGCDGVWDVLSSSQACRVVTEELIYCRNPCETVERACSKVINAAYRAGSTDNISVLLFPLALPKRNCLAPQQPACKKDKLLNPITGTMISKNGSIHQALVMTQVLKK